MSRRSLTPIGARMATSLRELDRVYGNGSGSLTAIADAMESGARLHPEAFAAYFRAVRAGLSDPPRPISNELTILERGLIDVDAPIELRLLSEREFGRRGISAVREQFCTPPLDRMQIGTVPTKARDRTRQLLVDAVALIENQTPNIWSEALDPTKEIIAAHVIPKNGLTLDGCTSLERHGAVLINMRKRRTVLATALHIVHESAHGLLFALSCNEHRVLNPASEQYQSPLRIDPRPVDGIYHAVFVLAWMTAFLAELAASPSAPSRMVEEAKSLFPGLWRRFLDGYDVLRCHADYTETGRRLMEEVVAKAEKAESAMTNAAGVPASRARDATK